MNKWKTIYKHISDLYQGLKPSPARKYSKELGEIIEPGDIICLRNILWERAWPGYWQHAGICVSGRSATSEASILHARGNGVNVTNLTNFISAQHVALLRPKLDRDTKEGVVKAGMELIGAPFDFQFDFIDNRKLSCIELVYLLYAKPLNLQLTDWVSPVGVKIKNVCITDSLFNQNNIEKIFVSSGAKNI